MTISSETEPFAEFSPCRAYRYRLRRLFRREGGTGPSCLCGFVMLNPSTATEQQDDPTIRRCIGFAKSWGYDGMEIYNLFALRSTDPRGLYVHDDPVGPDNDRFLREANERCDLLVCAWGNHGALRNRWQDVVGIMGEGADPGKPGILDRRKIAVLGVNGDGQPKHPLYLAADTKLMESPW